MKISFIVSVVALVAATAEAGFIGQAVKGIFGGRKRGLTARDLYARDLFTRAPTYENSLLVREIALPHLYARAAQAPKVNEKNQITVEAFVTMIKNKEMFPAALEAEVAKGVQGWMPPKDRKPCPKELADHPCDNALKVLQSGNLPKEITIAIVDAKNGWTKGGVAGGAAAAAAGAKGAGVGGAAAKAAPAGGAPAGGAPAGGAPAGGAPGAKKTTKRYAEPEAYYYDQAIYERDAYPEAYYEDAIYKRDAYPEAYYEDVLYERDAYPEAYYEDALYERDAYPEAYYEDGELYAREAEALFEPQWYY